MTYTQNFYGDFDTALEEAKKCGKFVALSIFGRLMMRERDNITPSSAIATTSKTVDSQNKNCTVGVG